MARIVFTPQLRRFIDLPDEVHSQADSLREALDETLACHPRLRGYVLDEQGHLRANVVVFVYGRRCVDRQGLHEPLQPGSQVHVLQALSGG